MCEVDKCGGRNTGWGSRIRTWPHGFRVRCPTARLIPSASKIIASVRILGQETRFVSTGEVVLY